jgi:hypothetical protein
MASQPEDQVLCRYAVAFGVEGPPAAGLLVVGDDGVVLRGSRGGEHVELSVPREELTRVRIGRSSAERLNGYKTIVLERRDGPDILVAPFGLALLHEITDLIGARPTRRRPPSESSCSCRSSERAAPRCGA